MEIWKELVSKHLKILNNTVGKLVNKYSTRKLLCMADLRPARFKINKILYKKMLDLGN